MADVAVLADPVDAAVAGHLEFLDRARDRGDTTPTCAASARAVWDALRAAVPGVRVPGASAFDGRVFCSWDDGRHHLEAEFLPAGEWEWFYTDRETRAVDGGDMNPGDAPPAGMAAYARLFPA